MGIKPEDIHPISDFDRDNFTDEFIKCVEDIHQGLQAASAGDLRPAEEVFQEWDAL